MSTRRTEFIQEKPCTKRSKSKLNITSPEDDWTKITDLSSRRRVQNRLAQRNHRANVRKRQEEEGQGRSSSSSSSASPVRHTSTEPLCIKFENTLVEDMSLKSEHCKTSRRTNARFQFGGIPTPDHSPDYLFSQMQVDQAATAQNGELSNSHSSLPFDGLFEGMTHDDPTDPLDILGATTQFSQWTPQYISDCDTGYFEPSNEAHIDSRFVTHSPMCKSWSTATSGLTEASFGYGAQSGRSHSGSEKSQTQGRTTLHLAAAQGHVGIIEMLMGFGLDVDSQEEEGKTALHMASAAGHHDAARLLLSKGASTGLRDNKGQTALHLAAESGSVESARLLLDFAADIDAKDILNQAPLHKAVEKGHENVVMLLLQSGANAR